MERGEISAAAEAVKKILPRSPLETSSKSWKTRSRSAAETKTRERSRRGGCGLLSARARRAIPKLRGQRSFTAKPARDELEVLEDQIAIGSGDQNHRNKPA